MMRRLQLIFVAICSVWSGACQEQPPDRVISQFERPQNVALVCWEGSRGGEGGPVPLADCDDAAISKGDRRLLAFVTQTTPGEVAVVDLSVRYALDGDRRIPYASFIPVGGMPSGIAATMDGEVVVTANTETSDLSLIDVRQVFDGVLFPTIAVDLLGAPSHLVISHVEGVDYIFVSLPRLSRVAVVRLAASETEGESSTGRLLGWMEFSSASSQEDTDIETDTDTDTDSETETQDPVLPTLEVPTLDGQAFAPAALEMTPQSLFVSATNASAILEFDIKVLVQRAESLNSPGSFPGDALVRAISLEGALNSFTAAQLAVEPGETPRWLYAVENQLGGLLAIDLAEGVLVEANASDRKAEDPESIELPGRAISVELVNAAEKGDAYDPLTFDGTFAVASTTMAAIYVLDVHDRKADPGLNGDADPMLFQPHSIRSRHNLSPKTSSDDTDSSGQRFLPKAPSVRIGAQEYQGDKAAGFLYFEPERADEEPTTAEDTGTSVDTEEWSDTDSFEEETDALPEGFMEGGEWLRGLAVRENPRDWVRDDWALTYRGRTGISGAAVADFGAETLGLGDAATALVVFDDTKDFCALGLKAGRGVNGEPVGDLFYLTSMPTPDPKNAALVASCEERFGEVKIAPLVYQVARVLDPRTLLIVNNGSIPEKGVPPLPSIDCYGQAFNYEIRAADHFILQGRIMGHLYTPGILDTDQRMCELPDDSDGRRQRVFLGERFSNYYFSFVLRVGAALADAYEKLEEDTDPYNDEPEVSLSFTTSGGFAPLSFVLGSWITDIATMPSGELVIIDQAAPALITFDLLSDFQPTFNAIN